MLATFVLCPGLRSGKRIPTPSSSIEPLGVGRGGSAYWITPMSPPRNLRKSGEPWNIMLQKRASSCLSSNSGVTTFLPSRFRAALILCFTSCAVRKSRNHSRPSILRSNLCTWCIPVAPGTVTTEAFCINAFTASWP